MNNKIEQIRRIVQNCQAGRVEGDYLDLFSASVILAVYDKLSEDNKKIYLSKAPRIMAKIAFKFVS